MGSERGTIDCKACCFSGFLRKWRRGTTAVRPDSSPGFNRTRVSSFEEALALERPREGSWSPSPRTAWASPMPSRMVSPADESGDVDFELVVSEGEAGASRAMYGVQVDTDIHRSLLCSASRPGRSQFEVEQLLCSPGGLPRPLTTRAREDAIRLVLPTATYEMLARLPPELLSKASAEAQELRRKLSRGATVVFMSAGLPSKRFTFERAAELGIKCLIIDHPDSWSAGLVAEGIVAKFIPVDMSRSSEEVFNDALEAIRNISSAGEVGAVDGIVTFVELSVPLVARLSEALGLPGHRPAAVDKARDKHATRAALRAAGLPTPRNGLIQSIEDAVEVGKHVGFPAVLKPVSGAASLGVRKVTRAEELLSSYKEIRDELSSLVVSSGALVKPDPNNPQGVKAQETVNLTVLCEQYLDGGEVDIDVVMSDGEWRYAAVSDNGPTLEPYFNETWAVSPSLLPKAQQVTLKELAVDSVKALGFESGVFHVECKYTSSGPQLIEVNARMGGGQVRECNLLTWGVDLVEETLFAALGIPAGPMVPKKPQTSVAYCYLNSTKSGIVTDVQGLESIGSRPGVVWAKPLVRPGAKAVGPSEGLPTWLCDLLVTAPSAKEALDLLRSLEAEDPVTVVSRLDLLIQHEAAPSAKEA